MYACINRYIERVYLVMVNRTQAFAHRTQILYKEYVDVVDRWMARAASWWEGLCIYVLLCWVCGAGNVEESVGDAAMVAMSFLRAHAAWVRLRFGLRADPRRRRGRDFRFSVGVRTCGISGGTAYAGQSSERTREVGKEIEG